MNATTTKPTTNFNFYECIILENINFEGYEVPKIENHFESINEVYKIFLSEYGHMIDRIGTVNSFREWLQGLPSVLTVPFYNSDILKLAYEKKLIEVNLIINNGDGEILEPKINKIGNEKEEQEKKTIYFKRKTEEAEDAFLLHYWSRLASSFFTLKDNL